MSNDQQLHERQAIIEAKLDLLLALLLAKDKAEGVDLPLPAVFSIPCPVCGKKVNLHTDLAMGTVHRTCGCRTGITLVPLPEKTEKEKSNARRTEFPDDNESPELIEGAGGRTGLSPWRPVGR